MRGILIVACLVGVAAPVQADENLAREFFDESISALRQGRFAEARDMLRESLELHPTLSAAFNLGVALRGTGETREAVRVLGRLLAGDFGELPEERASRVRALIEEIRAELARLDIRVEGVDHARLRINGEPAGEASADTPNVRIVDAGELSVAALAEDRQPVERQITVERGGSARVDLIFNPPPKPNRRPARIIGTLAAFLVVGAGVGVGLALSRRSDLEQGDVFGVTRTLRR